MRNLRTLLWALLLGGCSHAMVTNRPQTVLLGERYEVATVRDAVARAINRRHLMAQGEEEGKATALDTRSGANCQILVQYSNANLNISAAPSTADQGLIDERCIKEIDLLAKVISKEVERPGKVAAKAERQRMKHELAVEQNRRAAEEAALQREQLQQQQQQDQQQQDQPAQ